MILDILYTFLLYYLPPTLYLILYTILLVFAIKIFKRKSYKYGITLMISAILTIIQNLIFIGIQYPTLPNTLFNLGLPITLVSLIISMLGLLFMSLNLSSVILLFVSVYLIYKTHTHRKERIE